MMNLFKKLFTSKEPDASRDEFCCVYDGPDITVSSESGFSELTEFGSGFGSDSGFGSVAPSPSNPLETKPDSVIIGRHPDCDIITKDPQVSARHCQIKYHAESDTYTIRDLSSTNGTYVNDVRIGLDWTVLKIGDVIRLGTLSFSFEKECGELRVLRYKKTENL